MIVENGAGEVARRAEQFQPRATVWKLDGTVLTPAAMAPIELVPEPVIDAEIRDLLDANAVDVIIEHGEITGEYLGLEVARIVAAGGEQRLDVGVGAYDQDAFAMMNPDLEPADALGEVVRQVALHRSRGAEPHPINRLVRERWLRAELLADPSTIGLVSLRPTEAAVPRDGLHDIAPAFALGIADDDSLVLVACSVGIDLDLVPSAADLAAHHQVDAIKLVLPERDQHPVMRALAGRCARPCEILTADEPWPSS